MTGPGPVVVLDMQDRRPAWAMPGWVPERIRDALPAGGELRVVDIPADGSGDGSARVHPRVLEAVEGARAYLGFGIPAELLRRGRALEWVHSGAAGVGSSLTPELRDREGLVFTNSAGIHADPMAETVVGMILHFFRGLDFATAARHRERGRWDTGPFYAAGTPVRELSRSTVGVVGFGGVGRAVGRRCAALGARVLGLRRSGPPREREVLESVGGTPLDPPVTVLSGEAGLHRILEESHAVVLSAPETPETRGMIGRDALDRMRSDAILVNVGRGGLVDTEALVAALRDGRIRGAAVDVAREEPLPDDHPLWTAGPVLVTPHVSGVTDAFWERETDLIVENVERWQAGRPLRNRVRPERGY